MQTNARIISNMGTPNTQTQHTGHTGMGRYITASTRQAVRPL